MIKVADYLLINSSSGMVITWSNAESPEAKNDNVEFAEWGKTIVGVVGTYYSDGNLYADSDFSGDALTSYTQDELDALEEESTDD